MPIYCLNGKSTRKRSNNILDELIGSNNYYMSNSQQLSMASYHILMNKNNKSLSSTSLMMAIERFKNSVKNMKETVLIPTRLSDLLSLSPVTELNGSSELYFDCGELAETSSFTSLSPVDVSLSLWQHSSASVDSSESTMAVSMTQHNLYEQYKLLDLIDKILSSDATLTVSQRHYSKSLAIVSENDDNNNSKHAKCPKGHEENGKLNEQNSDGDVYTKKLASGKTSLLEKNRSNSASVEFAPNGHVENTNGNGFIDVTCPNASLDSNCSLLKIKDKLEYHLISLKNILSLMSSSADYITQKYLEDIQCEDRFDKQTKSCDQTDSIRHYYTSNNSATQH